MFLKKEEIKIINVNIKKKINNNLILLTFTQKVNIKLNYIFNC